MHRIRKRHRASLDYDDKVTLFANHSPGLSVLPALTGRIARSGAIDNLRQPDAEFCVIPVYDRWRCFLIIVNNARATELLSQ